MERRLGPGMEVCEPEKISGVREDGSQAGVDGGDQSGIGVPVEAGWADMKAGRTGGFGGFGTKISFCGRRDSANGHLRLQNSIS